MSRLQLERCSRFDLDLGAGFEESGRSLADDPDRGVLHLAARDVPDQVQQAFRLCVRGREYLNDNRELGRTWAASSLL